MWKPTPTDTLLAFAAGLVIVAGCEPRERPAPPHASTLAAAPAVDAAPSPARPMPEPEPEVAACEPDAPDPAAPGVAPPDLSACSDTPDAVAWESPDVLVLRAEAASPALTLAHLEAPGRTTRDAPN